MAMNSGPHAHPDTDDAAQRFVSQPVRPPRGSGPRHAAEDRPEADQPEQRAPAAAPVRQSPARSAGRSWRKDRWPLLADDVFRVAHDDWGSPRVHREVAKQALSAAVLAELLLSGHAILDRGALIPARVDDSLDPIGAAVMSQLRAESDELHVRDWLAFLTTSEIADRDLYDQVGSRLEQTRHVVRESPGLLSRAVLRRSARYVPLDINAAAWPWARLSGRLRQGERLDAFDTALGGLILAAGLHRHVLVGDAGDVETSLRRHVAAADVEIRELVYHTETAVGASVITGA